MVRVLVLGGSGLVGRFLIPRLVEAGYVVVAPSRNPPRRLDCPGVQWVTLDLGQAEAINELPESDVVVSMMPIWITAKLCAAMNSARPLRVIAFSSTSAVSGRKRAPIFQSTALRRSRSLGPRTTRNVYAFPAHHDLRWSGRSQRVTGRSPTQKLPAIPTRSARSWASTTCAR